MSMSIARNPNALITCGSAPASAAADVQDCSSLLPAAPPKDGTMSPPLARIVLIVLASAPPSSGRPPSHCGLQVPLDSTNAIVNQRTPVAFITVAGLGGLPTPTVKYGATCIPATPVGGGVVV